MPDFLLDDERNKDAPAALPSSTPRLTDGQLWAKALLDAGVPIGGATGGTAGAILGAPALALGPWGVLVPAGLGVSGAGVGGAFAQGIREGGYRAMGLGDAPGTIGGASREQATVQGLG